ncbi:MAG: hypothetical protein P8X69_15115 [Maritimibacter sp.]
MPKRLLGHQRQKCLIIMLQLADRLKSTAPRLMPQGSNLLGAEIGNGNDDIRTAQASQPSHWIHGVNPQADLCNKAVDAGKNDPAFLQRSTNTFKNTPTILK